MDICGDSVLLRTAVDSCIQHRDARRLVKVLDLFSRSGMFPSVPARGLLIEAGTCGWGAWRCKLFWRGMGQKRGLQPTALTLCCMVDALLSARLVGDAVELFVAVDTVVLSTLMEGFVPIGDANGARDIFYQLKRVGLQVHLVSFSALIDSQARASNMEMACELFGRTEGDGCVSNATTFSTMIKGHCM